jgi:hypothetical protein
MVQECGTGACRSNARVLADMRDANIEMRRQFPVFDALEQPTE